MRGALLILRTKKKPYLSVIIPTYRRPVLLRRCLVKLLEQSGDYEVFVVEDGEHKSRGIVSEFQKKRCVRYMSTPENQGPYQAINMAVPQCDGEIIAFLDDDAVPLPGWVSNIVEVTTNNKKDDYIVTGHVESLHNELNGLAAIRQNYYESRYKKYCKVEYAKKILNHFKIKMPENNLGYLIDHFSCANAAMPKRLFEKLGGFHLGFRTLGSNEFALHALTNGIPIFYYPKIRIAHQHDSSIGSMLCKMWVYGAYRYLLCIVYPSYAKTYPTSIPDLTRLIWAECRNDFFDSNITWAERLKKAIIVMTERVSYAFHANFRRPYLYTLAKKPRGLSQEKKSN